MANTTERIGVSYCSLIAAKTEWMFREQPIDDIGIDAHMEQYGYRWQSSTASCSSNKEWGELFQRE